MAREHLEGRNNWQSEAGERGQDAEISFSQHMTAYLTELGYVTVDQPSDLQGIYGQSRNGKPHGIWPEYAIRNPVTGKTVYVEVKRQRAKGNAHERACKYMMPGIIRSAQEMANQPSGVLPFWWVFTNGIARDFRYRQEIQHWFQGIEQHLLLWQDMSSGTELEQHFDIHIRPLLQ